MQLLCVDCFKLAKKHANFPFLCSNYDFSNTLLKNETKPYHVFNKDGIKIGVFGIGVELDGLVSKGNYGDTVYQNPIKIANRTAEILKQEGCDLIICLSHLGFSYDSREKVSDLVLASQTKNIHVIIGGRIFLPAPKGHLLATCKFSAIVPVDVLLVGHMWSVE